MKNTPGLMEMMLFPFFEYSSLDRVSEVPSLNCWQVVPVGAHCGASRKSH